MVNDFKPKWVIAGLLAWGMTASALAQEDASELALASVHAAVADLDAGTTLYSKHAERVVPIASVTKLMTAMVVLDSGAPLDEWLTIVEREEAPPNNSYSRMRIGSELTRGDLLRIMLMSSENLAAYVLASRHDDGVDGFVAAMNDKARALGMADTRFADPSGLSEGNRSTAADLVRMVTAAVEYDTIREYTQTSVHTARFRNPRYTLGYGNTNLLVRYDRWDVQLSKTGYLDAAGRCLALVSEFDGRRVAMILLDSFGTRTPIGDAGRIRRWIETGSGGAIAGPARDYERRKTAAYAETPREKELQVGANTPDPGNR